MASLNIFYDHASTKSSFLGIMSLHISGEKTVLGINTILAVKHGGGNAINSKDICRIQKHETTITEKDIF